MKTGPKPRPLAERFWEKVRKTKTCWLWTAARHDTGYGQIGIGGFRSKPRRAHRVSWEMKHGPIPKGLLVLHKCDIRACVRPSHLFLGTHKSNTQDAMKKGRLAVGVRHGRAKIGEFAVRAIRTSKSKDRVLARRYRVSERQIRDIKARRYWKHV